MIWIFEDLRIVNTYAVGLARPAPPHKGAGGGLPPPRGITAARPPFLPLRLDAWARLRGILGRLRGILGRLGTSKNAIESKTDFNIENEAKMKRPESPPESPGNYFWVPKCNQNRSKTRLKRLLFCIIFSMHFFFDLNSIFPPNLAPKIC